LKPIEWRSCGGSTGVLPPSIILAMWIPGTLLQIASMQAMTDALEELKKGFYPNKIMDFESVKNVVGFNNYYDMEKKYTTTDRSNE